MATQDTLVGEILTVLCQQGAYWARCTDRATGVNATALLTALQTQFPASSWTTTLVDTTLAYAIRRGSVTACADVTPTVYYARRDMVRLNPNNEQYRDVCAGIYDQLTTPNQFSI